MKKIIAIAAILASITFSANAQPGSTTGGFDDEPVDVPVDGGIILLVAAGVAFGYKKSSSHSSSSCKSSLNKESFILGNMRSFSVCSS